MASKLEKAVEIYKSLGYEEKDFDHILELGIGTKEEQKIAKEGLKSGEWTEFKQLSPNSYGIVKVIDVDLSKLAIFAIRVGVDAARAANILGKSGKVALDAISQRGEKYALDFISKASSSRRRAWEHSSSVYGMLCVNLVHNMNLEIPQSVEYIKDWAVHAGVSMGVLKADRGYDEDFAPSRDEIKRRFGEHIEVGISNNAPATGPFSDVFLAGLKEGLITKKKAKESAFFALDMALRPGDRKAWMGILKEIGIDEGDILSKGEALIPLIALGETAVTETFAPVLIEKGREDILPDILIASTAGSAKKIKELVLRSALKRERPESCQALREWFSMLKTDKDKNIIKLAEKVEKAWNIETEEDENSQKNVHIQGLWQERPQLKGVPKFSLEEISFEALTELAAEISNRQAEVSDLLFEKFLASVNRMAYENPEETKLSLMGIKIDDRDFSILGNWARNKDIVNTLDGYSSFWVEGSDEVRRRNISELMHARNFNICSHIQEIPCILSTPSFEDLSITLKDLTDRLLKYKEEKKTSVLEPDLQLALTRLDVSSANEEDIRRLKDIKLRVKMPDGESLRKEDNSPVALGDVVADYLKDPYVEPDFDPERNSLWSVDIEMPKSLRHFPNRFSYNRDALFSVFPLWGDFALTCVRRDTEVYHGQGLILKQVAKRREPFPKGALMNLLAIHSYWSDENSADLIEATKEAWDRGLLVEGRADARYLSWRWKEFSNLARLADSMDQIARDGMLSLPWQAADDIISESLKAPRMFSGTAELAKFIEKYLDEVIFAVEKGIAKPEVLELKGIRGLAQKKGTSAAVETAKEIVAKTDSSGLFKKSVETGKAKGKKEEREQAIPVPEIPFDDVWKKPKEARPIIDDGVSLRVEPFEKQGRKLLLFTLMLPDKKDREYKVLINGWIYGLDNEGQTRATEVAIGEEFPKDDQKEVWIHWNTDEKRMEVSDFRDWRNNSNGPLKGEEAPLSSSLLTVIIGMLAQDGDAIYYASGTVKRKIGTGEIGADMMRMAVKQLLFHEAVSPAKLVRFLEKEPELLPVCYVMLTECVRKAGEHTAKEGRPPLWVNRVLDICIYHGCYLKEAAERGLISGEEGKWQGLEEIAACKAKSTAVEKAKIFSEFIKES